MFLFLVPAISFAFSAIGVLRIQSILINIHGLSQFIPPQRIPSTGWLEQQTFISHSLEAGKSEIRGQHGGVLVGAPPGLETEVFFLGHSHSGEREEANPLLSLLIRALISSGGLYLTTALNLNTITIRG